MHLVDVVLAAHILVAIAAFMVAGTLHSMQWVSRSVTTVRELRPLTRVMHRGEPLFPILALILFLLGVWLLHLSDGEFRWSDGWVITATVVLAIMEGLGGAVLAPRGKALHAMVDAAPDGELDPKIRAALVDPVFWIVSHLISGLALGVVFLMAVKPNGWQSLLVVAIAGLIGLALGRRGAQVSSQPSREPSAAA